MRRVDVRYGEDELLEIALDAGAEDMSTEDDVYEVTTPPEALEDVKAAMEAKNVKIENAEVTMIPQNTIKIEAEDPAKKMLRLVENLEDQDDVQNVYANYDIPDEILEKLEN